MRTIAARSKIVARNAWTRTNKTAIGTRSRVQRTSERVQRALEESGERFRGDEEFERAIDASFGNEGEAGARVPRRRQRVHRRRDETHESCKSTHHGYTNDVRDVSWKSKQQLEIPESCFVQERTRAKLCERFRAGQQIRARQSWKRKITPRTRKTNEGFARKVRNATESGGSCGAQVEWRKTETRARNWVERKSVERFEERTRTRDGGDDWILRRVIRWSQ